MAAAAMVVAGCFPYVTTEEMPRVDRFLAAERIAPDTEVLVLRLTESLLFARSPVASTTPGAHGLEQPLFLTAGGLGRLQDELRRRNLGVIIPGVTGTTALISGARLREICLVFADGRVFSLVPPEYGDPVQAWKRLSAGAADPVWRDRLASDLSEGGAMRSYFPPRAARTGGCFPGWSNLSAGWSGDERRRVVAFLRRLPVADVKSPAEEGK